jgi:syntaxin 5
MLIAKKIGKELTNTCIKLEKLTDLAKKRSLFDDKPKEIQNLTNNIKEDINNLHSEISRLQQLVKANKNVEGKNMQKHSFNVVFTLQSKLANVSKDFKNVLEVRNENLKQQTERGEQFFSKNTLNPSSAASVFAAPKMPGSNNMGKSVLLYDGSSGQSGLNTYNNNPSKQQHGETVLNMDQMQQKQQLQHRLIVNEEDSFLRDRANAMQTVEQTIIELGGMFQQLATMIKEQDEAIQRIDSNVDDVDMNVNEAHSELLKYFQSVTSNRWLMIKIFLVLIVFFVVFIVVI